MPAKLKAMRKIREVLRLKFDAGLSHEHIAATVDVSKGTVTKQVQPAVAAGPGCTRAISLTHANAPMIAVSVGGVLRNECPLRLHNRIHIGHVLVRQRSGIQRGIVLF